MPAFGLMAVTAQDGVVLLLGEKWAGAGLLLSVLALRGIPHVVERSMGWLHVMAGRSDRWMRWGVISSAGQFVAIVIGLSFGLMGVATACVLGTTLLFIPAITYAGKPLGIGFRDVTRAVGPQMAGALIAAGLCHALGVTLLAEAPGIVRIVVLAGCYAASYVALVVWAFGMRTPISVVASLVGDALSRRALASRT
jgi:PST family polysaccharide transporter